MSALGSVNEQSHKCDKLWLCSCVHDFLCTHAFMFHVVHAAMSTVDFSSSIGERSKSRNANSTMRNASDSQVRRVLLLVLQRCRRSISPCCKQVEPHAYHVHAPMSIARYRFRSRFPGRFNPGATSNVLSVAPIFRCSGAVFFSRSSDCEWLFFMGRLVAMLVIWTA